VASAGGAYLQIVVNMVISSDEIEAGVAAGRHTLPGVELPMFWKAVLSPLKVSRHAR